MIKNCLRCEKEFSCAPSKNKIFCSKQCRYKYAETSVTCPGCGKSYTTLKGKAKQQKYCTKVCADKNSRTKSIVIKNCQKCGRTFSSSPYQKRKYCSLTCFYPKARICLYCNREFRSGRKASKFCSKKCSGFFRTTKVSKNCIECNESFTVTKCRATEKKCCSKECLKKHIAQRPKIVTMVVLVCAECDKEFTTPKKQAKGRKFCSSKCRNKNKTLPRIQKVCEYCNNSFEVEPCYGNQRFCGHKCFRVMYYIFAICQYCGNNFRTHEKRKDIARFCSVTCATKSHRMETRCLGCDELFSIRRSEIKKKKYCSEKCRKSITRYYEGENGGRYTIQQWEQKLAYFGHRCYLCHVDLSTVVIHKEHRIPIARGGTNWIANIAPACKNCNLSKHAKTEKEFRALIAVGVS